jgi:dipeptidyl aminopeptidase/acylaminoacyl peptidase
VIIAPDYRGSTGYGKEHHNAIDYGGKEVEDVVSAVEFLKTLPHVDQDRLGMMGWSHGGFITAHSLFRDSHPFKGGAAIVPVSNLFFRLAYKGPQYTRSFSTQAGIRGMPHENREEYIKRSPLYSVEKLQVPILVHVSTNDEDVNYVEDQQLVWKLRALKPDLAETKVHDPAPRGRRWPAFSRRVDSKHCSALTHQPRST